MYGKDVVTEVLVKALGKLMLYFTVKYKIMMQKFQ